MNFSKLLVKEVKGYSYRLLDLELGETFRLHRSEAKKLNLTVGSLLTCDYETSGSAISDLKIHHEVIGDSSKKRVEVDTTEVSVGDLIDGVPVLNLGTVYAKAGKKMAYAYFN